MNARILSVPLFLVAFLFATIPASAERKCRFGGTPLPADNSVAAPSNDVPEELRLFSGAFAGQWNYGVCHTLVIQSISASGDATIIYSWGGPGTKGPPDFIRKLAVSKIRPGKIKPEKFNPSGEERFWNLHVDLYNTGSFVRQWANKYLVARVVYSITPDGNTLIGRFQKVGSSRWAPGRFQRVTEKELRPSVMQE